jgi:sirohydrochlorin ferrochelatase
MEFDKKKTGVVIVDHGSRKHESNARLLEFVERFRELTNYKVVQPAHMELASPTILDAFQACQSHNVELVIVSPFFLLPGRHIQDDIPRLAREASIHCEDLPYAVAAPLGIHEQLVNVMEDRIQDCQPTLAKGRSNDNV